MPDEHELIRWVPAVKRATTKAQPDHDKLARLKGSKWASPELRVAAKTPTDAIWAAVTQSRRWKEPLQPLVAGSHRHQGARRAGYRTELTLGPGPTLAHHLVEPCAVYLGSGVTQCQISIGRAP
jgi:hypothetical protein